MSMAKKDRALFFHWASSGIGGGCKKQACDKGCRD